MVACHDANLFLFFFLLIVHTVYIYSTIIRVAYNRLSLSVCLSYTNTSNTFLLVRKFYPKLGFLQIFLTYILNLTEREGGGGAAPPYCVYMYMSQKRKVRGAYRGQNQLL
jgi:hypothetical protein